MPGSLLARLRGRPEWKFLAILPRANPLLAATWWTVLVLRSLLPALFAVAMGLLVGAVEAGDGLGWPLAGLGAVFVLLQVLPPLHLAAGANLGSSAAAWLYDELTIACVEPRGIGHLEDAELAADLTMARDFDLGISGPPLAISMDFIAAGLVELLAGLTAVAILFAYAWWAPLVLGGAWLATHWLLRESGVWKDRQTDAVREAQRHADYAYRLAVDAPAARELRLFGLADWIIERFRHHRRRLHDLRWEATKLRERPVAASLALVLTANVIVFWSLAADVTAGALPLDRLVMFAGAAIGASSIAFGGLSWALDGAGAPAAAVLRLREAMAPRGALTRGSTPAAGLPAREIRFSGVRFAYPTRADTPVLDGFDLTIPAGSSLAIVGQNGAGKTTLAKLLCRALRAAGRRHRGGRRRPARAGTSSPGASGSPPCSRTSRASSCRSPTTWRRPARPRPSSATRWRRPEPPTWPRWTPSSRAATTAGPSCPAASGSGSPWPGRSPRCGRARASSCSTSRPRSSTCAARPRSSNASCRRPAPRRPS